jgi:hypothetical protein
MQRRLDGRNGSEKVSGWNDFSASLGKGAAELATSLWNDYAGQAESDAQAFADASKADIQTWAQQTAAGEISQDDFMNNVAAEADIATLVTLTQALNAQEQVQRFRDGLSQLVVTAAMTALV